jgi:uncharacterized membrane protein YuzA (DUF378 family)
MLSNKMVCGNTVVNILFYISFFIVVIGAINWGLSAINTEKGGMNLVHRLVNIKQSQLSVDTPSNYSSTEKKMYYIIAISGVVAAITLFMKESGCTDLIKK